MPGRIFKRRDSLINSTLPAKRAMTLTVLIFIALIIVGGLMIGGFFSRESNSSAPFGSEDRRAEP